MNIKKIKIGIYGGTQFTPLKPVKEEVYITDIAHSLSNICRFNGHSKFFYSIAQHCMAVADMIKQDKLSPEMEMYGLLHDASECYISDLLSPVKACIPGYKNIEKNIEDVIYDAIGIPRPTPEELKVLKKYDSIALYVEAKHLMKRYESLSNITIYEKIDYPIEKKDHDEIKKEFLDRFNSLQLVIRSEKRKEST